MREGDREPPRLVSYLIKSEENGKSIGMKGLFPCNHNPLGAEANAVGRLVLHSLRIAAIL